ncbi:hypothetical protein Aph02nite_28830 [Actinoplanes philippinensis]|uniref:PknH-like extracellular domain-containing protein n=1 Tax=Actinoplanes philippinensis TaxID=35752 RepID=A0A1I2EKI5_9ACTN|nr:hypothetical protein [Actinoplanes philippinensis]GIE76933.1 hypothetical protein Aph02nite_28830 [Actinoplanes philippinensis]SFE93127.1 hypothetical protein SAMN05421541_104527 [Actinoplanes philippinensis]
MPSTLAVALLVSVVMTVTGPPDLGHLEAALLTTAEMPAGFAVAEGDDPVVAQQRYGYSDYCGFRRLDPVDQSFSGYALSRTFVRDGRAVTMSVGEPGDTWIHATVRDVTEQPAMCPEYSDAMSEVDYHVTAVPLPGAGPDAAAMAESWSVTMAEGGLNWSRDLTAVVARGDLIATFTTEHPRNEPNFVTDAEFATIVAAGARRLERYE